MQKQKLIESTIQQAAKVLFGNILAGVPTLFLSNPGVGKTTIVRQIGARLAAQFSGGVFVLSTREYNPIDLAGLWHIEDGLTKRAASDVIPFDKPVLILIDELGDCLPFEQSSWYRLLLENTLGANKLCAGSYVCAASNRADDQAAASELSSAIYGRCCCVTIKSDWRSLKDYAIRNKWDAKVIAFIGAFGVDCVNAGFNPEFPYCGSTPRDFERLNKLESAGQISADNEIALLQIVGNLDHSAGQQYFAFRQLSIPSPQLVFSNPASAPICDALDSQALYNAAILASCNDDLQHFLAITTYALRLNRVAGASLCWDLASAFGKRYRESPAFAKAALAFHELTV